MTLFYWIALLFFYFTSVWGTLIGNPGEPAILSKGLIHDCHRDWSFRLSFFGDYTYQEKFKDEFRIGSCTSEPTDLKFWTQAGILTFNARERLDLYVLAGGSKLQIDEDVSTSQQFAWGGGGKLIILHEGDFRLGIDLKYFTSKQEPQAFLCDNQAYNLESDFAFHYREIQAALGLSYLTKHLSPYINATYLLAKIDPQPLVALVRLPSENFKVDVVSKSVINRRRWGFALGMTLLDEQSASLSFEWRAINQNSVSIAGEIRF